MNPLEYEVATFVLRQVGDFARMINDTCDVAIASGAAKDRVEALALVHRVIAETVRDVADEVSAEIRAFVFGTGRGG